jgi:hypothetical protein
MPKLVFTSFDEQGSEFILGLGGGFSLQRDPFDGLASSIVLHGDASHKLTVAPPKPADCVLAIVQDFDISMTT